MKKRILIVEDDEAIRQALKELLETEDFEVLTAENGEDALLILERTKNLPSLIVADLMMPVLDGFKFCSILNESHNLKKIPIIIMSADGHVKQKQDATQAVAYLKKPVDIDEVINTINRYLVSEENPSQSRAE
jgi:DNA-binding response OmpR family regulator